MGPKECNTHGCPNVGEERVATQRRPSPSANHQCAPRALPPTTSSYPVKFAGCCRWWLVGAGSCVNSATSLPPLSAHRPPVHPLASVVVEVSFVRVDGQRALTQIIDGTCVSRYMRLVSTLGGGGNREKEGRKINVESEEGEKERTGLRYKGIGSKTTELGGIGMCVGRAKEMMVAWAGMIITWGSEFAKGSIGSKARENATRQYFEASMFQATPQQRSNLKTLWLTRGFDGIWDRNCNNLKEACTERKSFLTHECRKEQSRPPPGDETPAQRCAIRCIAKLAKNYRERSD
ncbi:hypothetical protein C8R44DRAFT_740523 [Mycena epipterygia]|nr:hypothetical protein C8R44DRAFT_740523 [Mycena epipterygia]